LLSLSDNYVILKNGCDSVMASTEARGVSRPGSKSADSSVADEIPGRGPENKKLLNLNYVNK